MVFTLAQCDTTARHLKASRGTSNRVVNIRVSFGVVLCVLIVSVNRGVGLFYDICFLVDS